MGYAIMAQFSIKTLLLLILLSAFCLRLFGVNKRYHELLYETSMGEVGRKADELRTRLGYLAPLDLTSQHAVPIPPIVGNTRRFRLYLPRIKGKRFLSLGMTSGNVRYILPQKKGDWPSIHQVELSDSEEQIVTISWLKSTLGTWIVRIGTEEVGFHDFELIDSDFLTSPENWTQLPTDFQSLMISQRYDSFDLWGMEVLKKPSHADDFGFRSGIRVWIESKP